MDPNTAALGISAISLIVLLASLVLFFRDRKEAFRILRSRSEFRIPRSRSDEDTDSSIEKGSVDAARRAREWLPEDVLDVFDHLRDGGLTPLDAIREAREMCGVGTAVATSAQTEA
jgi:hypothetical protein